MKSHGHNSLHSSYSVYPTRHSTLPPVFTIILHAVVLLAEQMSKRVLRKKARLLWREILNYIWGFSE